MENKIKRIAFLIDGFNFYHSVLDIKRYTGNSTKWLDFSSLCKSYIHLFGKDTKLEEIYYFTSIPYYLNRPDKIKRQRDYIKCLKSTGIKIKMGRFKVKEVYCDKCKNVILKHEEKETDVKIAIEVVALFLKNKADIIIIVSGDTDLSPAIETCKELFPDKKIVFAFPYRRKNKELVKLSPESF